MPISDIYKQLDRIPPSAKLSVSAALAPHLASRDLIYHFPRIADADYVVVLTQNSTTYPVSSVDFHAQVDELKANGIFIIDYEKEGLLILRRK